MINQTELNKLKAHIEKNKAFVDNIKSEKGDDNKKNTIALSMSILNDYYGLNQLDAYNSVTEGSEDDKIDAIYYSVKI